MFYLFKHFIQAWMYTPWEWPKRNGRNISEF